MAGIWSFGLNFVKIFCLIYNSQNLVFFNFRGDNARVFQRVSMNINMTVSQADSLVAFDSYQSEKVRKTQIVNLTVTTIWVRFTWRVLLLVREIFTAVVSEMQRGPHIVL